MKISQTVQALALLGCLVTAPAGSQELYSSSGEYSVIAQELAHAAIRPSRLAPAHTSTAAGELAAGQVKVDRQSGDVRLTADLWIIELQHSPARIAITNARTKATWALEFEQIEQIQGDGLTWQLRGRLNGENKPIDVKIAAVAKDTVLVSFQPGDAEKAAPLHLPFVGSGPFFGLGERFSKMKLDGTKRTLRSMDALGADIHDWTYTPTPFLLNPGGLGLYFDSTAISSFDFTESGQKKFSVDLDHGAVDCYFFSANSPKDVITAYTNITGKTPAVEPWTFGVWICSYQSPDRVLEDALRLRKEGIPASAIWTFDVMGEGTVMGWPLWWTGYYPDPRKFTDRVHELGFKSLTYVYPFVRQMLAPYVLPNPTYQEGLKENRFVLRADGKPSGPVFEPYLDADIDFTAAKNVDWWQGQLKRILVDYNFDGWMEDFGDTTKDTDRFADGFSGRDRVNVYPLIYHKITNQITQQIKPGAVEFSRSGYAGSQGFSPVIWGGDQHPNWRMTDGYPSLLAAGVTAGLSGFAIWGPDIDETSESQELWSRWVEFGALTPVMRTHPWEKPYGAVNIFSNQKTIALFRKFARLHVSLFPYFEKYAAEATKDGLPIMRHLLLEYPDDPRSWNAENEYMLGEQILVAPVIQEGATTRTLYLPPGSWVNYWTNQLVSGGQDVTVAAPMDQIPLFIRAGSILPSISPDTETLATDLAGNRYRTLSDAVIWRVFPGRDGKDSFGLKDGTLAAVNRNQAKISIQITNSTHEKQQFVLNMVRKPARVLLDGERLPEINGTDLKTGKNGWHIDAVTRTLDVHVQKRNLTLAIQL